MGDLYLRIGFDDGVSEWEADEETGSLLRVLERVDADHVGLAEAEEEAACGTRSGDPITLLGVLTMSGLAGRFVVKEVVTLVSAWLESTASRTVSLEVDGVKLSVKGRMSAKEVRALVDALPASAFGNDSGTGDGQAGGASSIEPVENVLDTDQEEAG